jgi:hypothetical protein
MVLLLSLLTLSVKADQPGDVDILLHVVGSRG